MACKQAIGFIFLIHYSEHFALQNVACKQCHQDLSFPIHYSEHFALQNVACKQAIGFIFPIHYSEHFALQNVACKQAIGFIFPIHYYTKTLCIGITANIQSFCNI